jgi:hypothetical protein
MTFTQQSRTTWTQKERGDGLIPSVLPFSRDRRISGRQKGVRRPLVPFAKQFAPGTTGWARSHCTAADQSGRSPREEAWV